MWWQGSCEVGVELFEQDAHGIAGWVFHRCQCRGHGNGIVQVDAERVPAPDRAGVHAVKRGEVFEVNFEHDTIPIVSTGRLPHALQSGRWFVASRGHFDLLILRVNVRGGAVGVGQLDGRLGRFCFGNLFTGYLISGYRLDDCRM